MKNYPEMIPAPIKVYTKAELCQMYEITGRTFSRMIKRNDKLYNELLEYGYRDSISLLSPKMVRIIFEYLEPPYIEVKEKSNDSKKN